MHIYIYIIFTYIYIYVYDHAKYVIVYINNPIYIHRWSCNICDCIYQQSRTISCMMIARWVPLVPPCWPTQGVGVWGMVPHHPRVTRVWAIVLAWRLCNTFMFDFKRSIHHEYKFSFVKYMLRSTWTELDLLSLLLPWPVDGQPWWGAVCTYNNNPKLTLCELWNVIVGIY